MVKSFALAGLVAVLIGLAPQPADADTPVANICVVEMGTKFGTTKASLRVTTVDGKVFEFRGKAVLVDNNATNIALTGSAVLDGNQVTYGYEGFPTSLFPVATKQGGTFGLNTFSGSGVAFRILPGASPTIIQDTTAVNVVPGLCPGD